VQTADVHPLWLLLCKFKKTLNVSEKFILSLAISDFISGLNGIIGSYKEDIGRIEFNLPIDMAQSDGPNFSLKFFPKF